MPTVSARALAILTEAQALIADTHIVYTSGRHGSSYVNKDAVYPNTARVSELCRMMAEAVAGQGAQVVCGPATGGIILSTWTGHHLGIPAVYAEKAPGGGMLLKRGYDKVVAGQRVLIVEDIVNTGGSLRETVDAVRTAGGTVVATAALCNRGGVTAADVGAPTLTALVALDLESWPAENCPLCRAQVPINTDVGKGREFLAQQAARGG
jgi:orotate phosphoribosyltransferase